MNECRHLGQGVGVVGERGRPREWVTCKPQVVVLSLTFFLFIYLFLSRSFFISRREAVYQHAPRPHVGREARKDHWNVAAMSLICPTYPKTQTKCS